MIKEGGDYDRRNRLSLYRARHLLSLRQFSTAAPLLIDALTTFAATELMEWEDLVGLAVLAGVVGLERGDVKSKIIDSPEVRQSFPERPVLEDFTGSLYACDYARFFRSLGDSPRPRSLYPRLVRFLTLCAPLLCHLQRTSSRPSSFLLAFCRPTLDTSFGRCGSRRTRSCWSRTGR